jgi:hypothetical protein
MVLAVSCPSIALCVAATNNGDVITSTNPTGGASAWTKTTIARGNNLIAISCPSVSLCVAIGGTGLFTSTNPTGGASAWTKTTTAYGSTPIIVDTVSCPSVSLCVAGGIGTLLTSTDPTNGAAAWTAAPIDQENDIYAISCPSISLCVAVDQSGNILTSTAPTGGADAWTGATVDIPGCPPQSTPCISEQLVTHDHQGTRVLDMAPPDAGNSIGNIALDGDSLILTWTHDGAQRQHAFR